MLIDWAFRAPCDLEVQYNGRFFSLKNLSITLSISIQFSKMISFYHLKNYFIYTISFYNIPNVGETNLSPIRYCSLWKWTEEADATRMNLLNPTSGRDASYPQLISMSSQVGCTHQVDLLKKTLKSTKYQLKFLCRLLKKISLTVHNH